MSWGEEDIPGRLTKRQRTWRAKRSVRVLGETGLPPVDNPGTSVMDTGPLQDLIDVLEMVHSDVQNREPSHE